MFGLATGLVKPILFGRIEYGWCVMRRILVSSVASILLLMQPPLAVAQRAPPPPAQAEEAQAETPEQRSKLADAAVIAIIIAASIAAYKAMGRPCACPSDTMKNGASCGNRSAWAKPGGAKPLCFPTDVTPVMMQAWRATKSIPGLF